MNGDGGKDPNRERRRGKIEAAANNAVLTLAARTALILMVGVSAWAAPRVWDSMEEMARLLDRATWRLDLHETRLDAGDRKVEGLERRLRGVERATPPIPDHWQGYRDRDEP